MVHTWLQGNRIQIKYNSRSKKIFNLKMFKSVGMAAASDTTFIHFYMCPYKKMVEGNDEEWIYWPRRLVSRFLCLMFAVALLHLNMFYILYFCCSYWQFGRFLRARLSIMKKFPAAFYVSNQNFFFLCVLFFSVTFFFVFFYDCQMVCL